MFFSLVFFQSLAWRKKWNKNETRSKKNIPPKWRKTITFETVKLRLRRVVPYDSIGESVVFSAATMVDKFMKKRISFR
jgi:hypothetical protein